MNRKGRRLPCLIQSWHGASAKQAGALIQLYRSIGDPDTRGKTVRKRPSSSPSVQTMVSPDLIQPHLVQAWSSTLSRRERKRDALRAELIETRPFCVADHPALTKLYHHFAFPSPATYLRGLSSTGGPTITLVWEPPYLRFHILVIRLPLACDYSSPLKGFLALEKVWNPLRRERIFLAYVPPEVRPHLIKDFLLHNKLILSIWVSKREPRSYSFLLSYQALFIAQ